MSHSPTRNFLIVRNLVAFVAVMWATYAAIYLADPAGVGLPQGVIALLPLVSAVVTLVLILFAAQRVSSTHTFSNLVIGAALPLVGGVVFLASPQGTVAYALVYTALAAIGTAFFMPANQSYWANIVGARERAAAFSAGTALSLLVALPAGPLAGALYTWQPKAPFVVCLILQALALALIIARIPRAAPIAAYE